MHASRNFFDLPVTNSSPEVEVGIAARAAASRLFRPIASFCVGIRWRRPSINGNPVADAPSPRAPRSSRGCRSLHPPQSRRHGGSGSRDSFIEEFLGAPRLEPEGRRRRFINQRPHNGWCLTMARSTVPQLSRPRRRRAAPQRSGEALSNSVMLWLIVVGLAVVAFYAL
jgi:hypothetical protein